MTTAKSFSQVQKEAENEISLRKKLAEALEDYEAEVDEAEARYELARYNLEHPPTLKIKWTCDECKTPVEAGDGYLCVDSQAANRKPAGTLNIEWRVYHANCDPEPERGTDYWIAVHRIRDASDVMDWTAHLSSKRWIKNTTWNVILGLAARQAHAVGV